MNKTKKPRGRPFPKGNSGRKRGSKNKSTLLAASFSAEQSTEILGKAIEMAKAGNVTMIKFLLERALPKERVIPVDLPQLDSAYDSIEAMSAIVEALTEGRITPSEAADLTQVVATYLRSIETTEAVGLLDSVSRKLEDNREKLDAVDPRRNGKRGELR
jgi:hypothetical protein